MDTYTAWFAVIISLMTLGYSVRRNSRKDSKSEMEEHLKPIVARLNSQGAKASANETAISKMAVQQASFKTQLDAHEREDDRRFTGIENMLGEIRDDVKVLLLGREK